MKKTIQAVLTIVLGTAFTLSHAQESYWIKTDSLFRFVQPSASMQLWSIYSMGEQAQRVANGPLEPVQDRFNFMARRARLGFKGRPYKRLNYVFTIQYDNLGKDKFSAVRGGTNAGTLGILDAYLAWQLTRTDLISITMGYLQPQFSRECITGDLLVNSLDKSPSQTYIRQHITGRNYGRVTGINIGGMKRGEVITIGYNAGIFNNNSTSADLPETSGFRWSPLMVERITLTIGDPEMKTYSINYEANNYYNKRKGVTFSGYASQQSTTDTFTSNSSIGGDILLNYGGLNLDGEWNILRQQREDGTFKAQTGHVRIGYNLVVAKKAFIEPCFMMMNFKGDEGAQFSGNDRMYDLGINWYLNKQNCKLGAHYIWQEGNGNNGYTDGITFKKGNFIALALVVLM
jgi:Phosphate-selective porin O and P